MADFEASVTTPKKGDLCFAARSTRDGNAKTACKIQQGSHIILKTTQEATVLQQEPLRTSVFQYFQIWYPSTKIDILSLAVAT